jgi:hypothetical protein
MLCQVLDCCCCCSHSIPTDCWPQQNRVTPARVPFYSHSVGIHTHIWSCLMYRRDRGRAWPNPPPPGKRKKDKKFPLVAGLSSPPDSSSYQRKYRHHSKLFSTSTTTTRLWDVCAIHIAFSSRPTQYIISARHSASILPYQFIYAHRGLFAIYCLRTFTQFSVLG